MKRGVFIYGFLKFRDITRAVESIVSVYLSFYSYFLWVYVFVIFFANCDMAMFGQK